MPITVISSKTRSLYELLPDGEFVLNDACDQAKGLVAWWPLSAGKSRYLDYSKGQKFPLTRVGTNGFSPVKDGGSGWSNTGSTSNYFQTVATPPVTAVPYTLNGWIAVRTTTEYNAESVLININGSAGSNYVALLYDGANGEGNGAHVGYLDRAGSNAATWSSSTTLAGAGSVGMITGVVAGVTDASIFLNAGGKQNSNSSRTPTSWDRYAVGAYKDSGSAFSPVNGLIWNCAVWNIALTDAQVVRLYDPKSRYELYYPIGRRSFSFKSASGGSTTPISPTGSSTASGSLRLQVNKGFSGFVTTTGALAKAVAKALAGSSTATGLLTKAAAKPMAGSCTCSGSQTRSTAKGCTGSVTASGALTKSVAKALAGSVTASGQLTKAVAKPMSGSVTASGSLANTRVTVVTYTGSCTGSGSLSNAKTNGAALSGSCTASGATTRACSKATAGSSTATGSLTKVLTKPAYTGSVTSTGSLGTVKQSGGVAASGSVTATATERNAVSKALSGRCQSRALLYGNGVLLDSDANHLLLLGV